MSIADPMPDALAADRRGEILLLLDQIHDPCSISIGRPIGLVGMGIIEAVTVVGDKVAVTVLPTFPDCLFRGVFEAEIEARVGALAWCRSVSVTFAPADRAWDESRMTPDALRRLGRKKQPDRSTA
jgi:metal-sulfur cluster biosynthetic enzyme